MAREIIEINGEHTGAFLACEKFCEEPFDADDLLEAAKRDIIELMLVIQETLSSSDDVLWYLKYAYHVLDNVQYILSDSEE